MSQIDLNEIPGYILDCFSEIMNMVINRIFNHLIEVYLID